MLKWQLYIKESWCIVVQNNNILQRAQEKQSKTSQCSCKDISYLDLMGELVGAFLDFFWEMRLQDIKSALYWVTPWIVFPCNLPTERNISKNITKWAMTSWEPRQRYWNKARKKTRIDGWIYLWMDLWIDLSDKWFIWGWWTLALTNVQNIEYETQIVHICYSLSAKIWNIWKTQWIPSIKYFDLLDWKWLDTNHKKVLWLKCNFHTCTGMCHLLIFLLRFPISSRVSIIRSRNNSVHFELWYVLSHWPWYYVGAWIMCVYRSRPCLCDNSPLV